MRRLGGALALLLFLASPTLSQTNHDPAPQTVEKPEVVASDRKQEGRAAVATGANHSADNRVEHNEQCEYQGPAGFEGFYCFFFLHDKFWVSFGTLILAVSTGVLGFATVFLWLATKRLVRGADETAQRQLRAYVSVKEVKMDEFKGPTIMGAYGAVPGPTQHYRIEAVLENGGQTPTRLGIVNVNWKINETGLPKDFDFPDGPKIEKAFIGPGCTFGTPGFFIPVDDIAGVVLKIQRAFVWGWIDYNDVFLETPRHRTEFCFEIVPDQVTHDKKQILRFSPYGRFNGAEGDCLREPKPYAEPV